MRLTVSQKVNIGGAAFAAVICLIAAGIFIGGRAIRQTFERMEQRSHTTALLNELQFITQELTEAEGDFIITQQIDDSRRWNATFRQLLTAVDAVDDRLSAPEQRAALEDFTLAQLEYKKAFTEIHTLVIRMSREVGHSELALVRRARFVSLKKSIVLTNVMIEAVHDMVSFNQQQAERESVFALATLHRSQLILVALVAMGILATFVLRVFAVRTISQPIARLTAASRDIAQGRFDLDLATDSRDEIGELARSVQAMAKELEASYADLEEKVAERTADLARSNADLEQFAYVASHDLQEPLRTISGFAQLLARRYQGSLDAKADQYIGFLTEGARRMQDLVRDLLAYSRIRSQRKAVDIVDCGDIVAVVLSSLEKAIEESKAELIVEPLPEVLSDKTLMTQLFLNLIANALKFHRDEPPRIQISATQKGDRWEFSIQDNGIGMEARHIDRIFTIFQRLHPRTEYEGTGMGLAICKKIVEQHDGELWVDSRPGVGSTFYWTMPILRSETPDEEHRDA